MSRVAVSSVTPSRVDQFPKSVHRGRRLRAGEFGEVAATELGEPLGPVAVPAAQRRGWGDVLEPLVQVGGVLAHAPWPHPVDQHPEAVVGRRVVVDADGCPQPPVDAVVSGRHTGR
jgi:hypothetical protein